MDAYKLREAMNAKLAEADERIAILETEQVDETFHARFSARKRHYLYRIFNRRPPLALERLPRLVGAQGQSGCDCDA